MLRLNHSLPLFRFALLATIALLSAISAAAPAPVPAPLVLTDAMTSVDLWPAVRVLRDPDRKLAIENVIASAAEFATPESAYAALGLRQKVVWLQVPLSVPAQANGRWILDLDYTLLNRIDVHVVSDGNVIRHAVLGNMLPFSARPLPSRAHAVVLELPPGHEFQLYLRIETIGSMILPVRLSKLAAFHQRAVDEQMLQGVLTSLGLCLLLYSLMQWISLREHLYLKYSLLVFASTLFSVHFFGIGEQYLWTDNAWLERHMAGITSLAAAFATALFIEDVLGSDMSQRLRRAMRILAAVLGIAALAYALDLIDIYVVGIFMGTLALLPALMGLPGAIARVRRGDSVGAYFILAWVGYFVASVIMVGVVKGNVGADFWSMHSFQFGATIDMLIFMRIAVLRSAAVHVAAQRATREHETLHSLAHSDPLTGLLNRRGLNTTLAAALHNCNPEQLLAVYMLDLDGFKPVNDQFGHDVGDELLAIVAQRLRATMRTGDVVARVGGDEFVVMAGGLQSDQQASELGGKLLEIFRAPFALEQESCRVGVTIGYVLAPIDGHDAAGMLKSADAAMYAGKQAGKNMLRRGSASAGV
ncbi:MAG: diguanylate cyclase [Betaproteobacteria bacterium]